MKKRTGLEIAQKEYSHTYGWFLVAAVVAFLSSAIMLVKFWVGGVLDPTLWTAEQWVYFVLGVGMPAVVTAAQVYLNTKTEITVAVAIGLTLVALFNFTTETGNASERAEEAVRARSAESPTFKALTSSLQNMAGAGVNSAQADATKEAATDLARCEQRLAQGKEPHCEGSRAAYQAAKDMVSASIQGQQATFLQGVQMAKGMEQDESYNYAVIKTIAAIFGTTGRNGTIIFSTFIVLVFQYAFWMIGQEVKLKRDALERVTQHANRVDTVKFAGGETAEDAMSKPVDKVKQGVYTSPDGVSVPDHVLKAVWSAMYHGHITTASVNEKGQVADLVKTNGYCGKSSVEVRPFVEAIMHGLSDPAIAVVTKNDKAGLPKYTINNPIPSPSMGGQPRRHNHPPPMADDDGLAVA